MYFTRITGIFALLILLTSGCITISGDKLTDISVRPSGTVPSIEDTIAGTFSFHLDGGKMITSNKAGRIINEEVLRLWHEKGLIHGAKYVKSSTFTGGGDYNLTLDGNQNGESSILLQIISGLTLTAIPYYVTTQYDLRYTLENSKTGAKYSAKVSDEHTTVVGLLLFPFMPFAQGGRTRTMERIGNHVYQQLSDQDAFNQVPLSPRGSPVVESSPSSGVKTIQPEDAKERLRKLDDLKTQGLITEEEYQVKRQQILDAL